MFVTKEQFIQAAGTQDESAFLVEKENDKIYLISDMEHTEDYGLRIESMRFEIFVDGAEDFLEESGDCRGRNCGGTSFYGEDVNDDDEVRQMFYDEAAKGFIICLNKDVYKILTQGDLKDGCYFVLLAATDDLNI